jgi:hypothetical protein
VCLKTRNLPKWPKWWMKYGKTYWKIMNQWGSINLGLAYLQTNPAVYSLVDQGIEVTRAVVSEVSDLMTSLLVWMMILQAAKIFGWWMVTIQLDGVAYTVFLVYTHSIFFLDPCEMADGLSDFYRGKFPSNKQRILLLHVNVNLWFFKYSMIRYMMYVYVATQKKKEEYCQNVN